MPFGLGTAPVLMSALATSLAQHLRQHFQFTWAHMDDFIIADNSKRPFQLLPHILRLWESAGIQIKRAKSRLQPNRKLEALGAVWSNSGLSITASRQPSVLQAIEALPTTRPGWSRHKQHMGLLTYVTPFLPGTPYALTTALGRAPSRDNAQAFAAIWAAHHRRIPWTEQLRPPDMATIAASDATTTGITIVA